MRVLDAPKESEEMRELLDQVGAEPLMIRRGDRDAAVLLSPTRYLQLQKDLNDDLFRTMTEIGRQAEENGLTPNILDEILSEAKSERAS